MKRHRPRPPPPSPIPFSGAYCAGLIEAVRRDRDSDQAIPGFPALIAPASLKPGLRVFDLPQKACFPALIAPASLKHGFFPGARRSQAGFSGAYCAGLIEASAVRLFRGRPSRFPALIAPASLKQSQRQAFITGSTRGFPAPIAPASLKRRRAGHHEQPDGGFPALIAPASLKQLLVPVGQILMIGFPALIAPASLKRFQGCRPFLKQGRFSGAYCAGLIEAELATAAGNGTRQVFRRLLRRPH